jgi:sialidase-1
MTVITDNGALQAGNCAPVVDLTDTAFPGGRIFLFYNTGTASEQSIREGRGIREVWYRTSADQGFTWSQPVNITTLVHKPYQPSIDSVYSFKEDWRAFANTPGHALQLTSGRFRGRIYVAANHSAGPPLPGYTDGHSFGYYTDDHGVTFHISDELYLAGSNEATAAETDSGGIYLNARNQQGDPPCRIVSSSRDGGATWGMVYYDCMMPDPVCQGSVLNVDYQGRNILFFTNPATHTEREKLTLRLSLDQGKTWNKSLLLVPGEAAYSDLCRTGDKTLGCFYEKGSNGGIYFLSVDYSSLLPGR